MKFWKKDALRKYKWIGKYLDKKEKILDLGCGSCHLTKLLIKNGYNVTPIDVENLSAKDIQPIIYNGYDLPFKDNAFDLALILTVLHHAKNFKTVIKEAKRVSKRIIVIEDIYRNNLQKFLIYFFDSLFNLEFFNHPHNNLSDKEWKQVFIDQNLTLEDAQYHKINFFCTQATYCLRK